MPPAALVMHVRLYNVHVALPLPSSRISQQAAESRVHTEDQHDRVFLLLSQSPEDRDKMESHSVIICALTEKFMTLVKI